MKQILIKRAGIVFRVFVVTVIYFSVSLLADAKAELKSTTQAVSTSSSKIVQDSSTIVFDGYGTLDAILNFSAPQSAKDNGGIETPVSVIIDGAQYELAIDAVISHYLLQKATIDDLKPEASVGFKKDPSGKIAELWILKPDKKKMKERDWQKSAPSVESPADSPSAGSQNIKKEGDVWKN